LGYLLLLLLLILFLSGLLAFKILGLAGEI
jgi:hypothetical protein